MFEPVPLLAAPPEWDALAAAGGNPFATPEWCLTWWRHFGRGRPLLLRGLRRADGTLAAVLPLFLATRVPARVVRFAGHGAADETGPACAPADRPGVAAALGAAVPGAWDLLIADDVAGDAPPAPGARLLAARSSPVLRFPRGASWDDLLATRSRGFREQARARERRLARLGTVTHRFTRDPAHLEADLDALFALHAARWGGRSRAFAGREAFHRDFAARALARGWLRLRLLELDGRPVAALYNLRFGASELFYQSGRDPAMDRWSVGFVLHTLAIRDALEAGVREYRLLRGGESYKRRFATADPGVRTVALARTARGWLLLAALGAQPALPPTVRRCVPDALAWGSGG
jgi:CelD/BcsL family acetyltransferase involved in cellulose biosynthesis